MRALLAVPTSLAVVLAASAAPAETGRAGQPGPGGEWFASGAVLSVALGALTAQGDECTSVGSELECRQRPAYLGPQLGGGYYFGPVSAHALVQPGFRSPVGARTAAGQRVEIHRRSLRLGGEVRAHYVESRTADLWLGAELTLMTLEHALRSHEDGDVLSERRESRAGGGLATGIDFAVDRPLALGIELRVLRVSYPSDIVSFPADDHRTSRYTSPWWIWFGVGASFHL